MLWHPKTLQNLAMYNVFFIFGRFSIAGKLPKWPKIPFQYPLALRHPKILEKCRKHHRILVSVRNRFWAPPAKADIATAILTNVIEHLVLLFCPPISTPSPPKRCGRIYGEWQSKHKTEQNVATHGRNQTPKCTPSIKPYKTFLDILRIFLSNRDTQISSSLGGLVEYPCVCKDPETWLRSKTGRSEVQRLKI